jgi:hypothetical protein
MNGSQAPPPLQAYVRSLRAVWALVASLGTGVIALQWKTIAPPFFSPYPAFGILVVALVLVWVHFYTFPSHTRRTRRSGMPPLSSQKQHAGKSGMSPPFPQKRRVRKRRMPPLVRLGLSTTGISLFVACIYLALFRYTTIADPLEGKRYQIGFGKMRWSLTPFAREYKDPSESIHEWMMQCACFHEDGPRQLWSQSSIIWASITLGTLFLAALALGIAGWAMIAKHLAMTKATKTSPKT